ncbi:MULTISPECIES: ABC transporter permease [unclassified Phaeobacter]|uniref:ABC transporter permease n=1 Tax=unclassified Phaeobacter TaxID=2621772 RepID=UPI003A884496
MTHFILRRLGVMLLTTVSLTFIVFFLTNLTPNLEKLAKSEANARMSDEEVSGWLAEHGYDENVILRYGQWLGVVASPKLTDTNGVMYTRCARPERPAEIAPDYCGLLQGELGFSSVFKIEVTEAISNRLSKTGYLMLAVMCVMVPLALLIGILAGMREGSIMDRVLSAFAIITTSTPEYVSAIILIAVFASKNSGVSPQLVEWGMIEGPTLFKASAATALNNITFANFTLPVTALTLYGMGYIARMTRASMAEVMTQQYIRTARLKGVPFRAIVLKHALRNAMITPFTVIMLQFPWLLTGVVIVETIFNYKGFGWSLVQAAGNNDIELLMGISIVAVIVVLLTQLISDIGYVYLNPRIRVS